MLLQLFFLQEISSNKYVAIQDNANKYQVKSGEKNLNKEKSDF